MPTDTLNLNEAAEFLGVSYTSVFRYIKSGILPAYRWGGPKSKLPWRIKRADLEAFANGQKGMTHEN